MVFIRPAVAPDAKVPYAILRQFRIHCLETRSSAAAVEGLGNALRTGWFTVRQTVVVVRIVEKTEMRDVEAAFVHLQVIRFVKQLVRIGPRRRRHQKLIVGKQRRLPRPHVRKYAPRLLMTLIRRMPDLIPMLTAAGLPWLIQAFPRRVEQPTMIDTTQPAVFHPPVA